MYNFVTGMIILSCVGFGFYEWAVGGFIGKLVCLFVMFCGVMLYFRWEKYLLGGYYEEELPEQQ